MKKFFPVIFAVVIFATMMIVQMVVNGKDLSASKLSKDDERYQLFESNFKKSTFTSTKENVFSLQKVKEPIVILNFWASWCRPCLSEFSTLKKLIKKYPNKILVLGINNDEENPKKAIYKTEKDLNLNFESIVDADSSITNSFHIERIPASIAFHKGKAFHFINEEFNFMNPNFLEQIENLLKE